MIKPGVNSTPEEIREYMIWMDSVGGLAIDKTLLDDFAGQAMQVLLTDDWIEAIEEITKGRSMSHNAIRSEWCYDIAEAMVEEKRKREE